VSDRSRKEFKSRQWAFKTVKQETDRRAVQQSLTWAAIHLNQHNQVELLIEKISLTWLGTKTARRQYRLTFIMIGGLIGGLAGGLSFRLVGGLIGALVGGLSFGLIGELSSGLIIDTFSRHTPVEQDVIVVSVAVKLKIRCSLGFILIFGLIFGLMQGVVQGIVVGLVFGLVVVLALGLSLELLERLRNDLKIRLKPNQDIWSSFQSALWKMAFSYPLAVILLAIVTQNSSIDSYRVIVAGQSFLINTSFTQSSVLQSLFPGIISSLLFSLFLGGGLVCIQHLSLRIILTRHHKIPWNLAQFLTYCHERRLLQQIGGRYRFIHRELLDHFAGKEA
jgi:hypothetical protein